MNVNALTITLSLIAILAATYLVYVIKKAQNHNMPFLKAINPFYTKEMNEMALLKQNLHPIMQEVVTKTMAKFINHWTAKFENGTLSEQDVLELNAKIEEGNHDQVNGILALHPEGKPLFEEINARLKAESELVSENEVLA